MSGASPRSLTGAPTFTLKMLNEERCVVAFCSNVLDQEVDGREKLLAHVVCEDGRIFDARRFKGIQNPFTIRPCNLDVC